MTCEDGHVFHAMSTDTLVYTCMEDSDWHLNGTETDYVPDCVGKKDHYCSWQDLDKKITGKPNCFFFFITKKSLSKTASCSNYIFILDLTPGFKGLDKDDRKTRGESFKFCDLVRLILEIWAVFL